MDIITFVVSVYCLVADRVDGLKLRGRGRKPTVSDAEVLTMEIVGEYLGVDTEVGLYRYFRCYYQDWFPNLARIHRTTFTRQMANLWRVKQLLWKDLVAELPQDSAHLGGGQFPGAGLLICSSAALSGVQGSGGLWSR